MKIDIWDDGILTPEVFRWVPGTYGVIGKEFRAASAKIWALWAKRGNTPAHKGLVRPYTGHPYEDEKERAEGKESVE